MTKRYDNQQELVSRVEIKYRVAPILLFRQNQQSAVTQGPPPPPRKYVAARASTGVPMCVSSKMVNTSLRLHIVFGIKFIALVPE